MGVLVFRHLTMCRDSPTMTCRAEVTGSLVPTVAKQMQSVEPWTKQTNWETGKERAAERGAAQRRDVTQTRRQKEVEETKLWVTGIASTAKKKPSRIFAREPDLPGWCRCEGSRETELPPDSLGPRRRPPASSRPGRGWSRWTCHPLRHTPPWAGEQKKKKIISHRVDGGVRGGGSWHRNLFLRELNLRFVFCYFGAVCVIMKVFI